MKVFKRISNPGRYNDGDISGLTRFGVLAIIGAVIGLIVLVRLATGIRAIGVGQVGVVTSYGTVKGEVSSGLHFIWPWETVTGMSVQTVKDNVQAGAATQDLQQLDANVNLNYHLNPSYVDMVYRKVGPSYDATIVQPALQEAVKANTAKFNADQEITNRATVEADIQADLVKKLQPWGISVDTLSILDFGFSSQYSAAIENKQVEQQNVAAAQYKLQQAQLNAQANQAQDASLSQQILEQQAIAKWDGKMPQVINGNSSSILGINLQGQ